MRKGLLLIAAVAMGSWMFCVFWGSVEQRELPTVAIAEETTSALQPVWELPQNVPGTDLIAHCLGVYDGPFMEDGSGDEVIGVAALMLENAGEAFIESGEVVLYGGGETLMFTFFMLPPGEKILVPERNRQTVRPRYFTGFDGSVHVLEEGKIPGCILVEERDIISLAVTNSGKTDADSLVLIFKNIDTPSGVYIGGDVKEVILPLLAPGQTVEISPYGYVRGYTKVVAILRG